MKIVTCIPEAARLALPFNAHPCEYIYDSDECLPPQRVFQWGPEKKWAKDGRGFPVLRFDFHSFQHLRRGMRGYLNAEHYGPDFYTKQGNLPQPMRAIGLSIFGTQEAAQIELARWLAQLLCSLKEWCGECGAYNWYPFDGMSDYRAIVLAECDVWSPSIYVKKNGDRPAMALPLSPKIMPPKPIVPVVCLDALNGEMLGQTSWTATFHYAQNMGAKELLLWGTSSDVERTRTAGTFMANGAGMAGIELEPRLPAPPFSIEQKEP